MNKVIVGCEVAFNTLPDAVWFEVLKKDGFSITVRECNTIGITYEPHITDVSLVKRVRNPK